MKDIDLDRKIASSWKEYLVDLGVMRGMFAWVWQEFITSKGKSLAKKMFWASTFGYMIGVINPWLLSNVFNGLSSENYNLKMVLMGLSLYCLAICLSRFIDYLALTYRELLFGETICLLDTRLTELFFEKSLGKHIDENNLLNKANLEKGHRRIENLIDLIVWEGIESILGLILPFVALWVIDWKVGIVVTGMVLIHLCWSIFLNQIMIEKGIPINRDWRAKDLFEKERWDKKERVKTNHKERDELNVLRGKLERIIGLDRKLWLWHIKQIIIRSFVDYFALFLVMSYGVYQVWQGRMTLGLLYPLFTWTKQMADNLWRIGHLEKQINFVTPAILAVKDALTMPIGIFMPQKAKYLPEGDSYRVEFNEVSYTYPERKGKPIPVISDISFVIEPGEKIALIGSTGAGKTTLMRLFLRFMDPTEGEIRINGIDLKELDLSWLRMVGYMPQESQILNGNIRYNLLYGLPDNEKAKVSDKDLWRIMHLLKIDFGERLTQGLDTLVGYGGIKLSGGQAQRLMLGGAIVKDPKIMVIDEATSNLDATTERLVQEGLEKVLIGNRSALIVTHRLNTIRRICNKFVMLSSNGHGSQVVAIASSFEELAEKSEEFRFLALDQGIEL